MVNMHTADQVLRSPAQVTYPTSGYILSLTRKKKEEAAARAKAEAQETRNDGEDEDEVEGLEMALRAPRVPREPGQVVYLSPKQFRTLTVKKAEEQTPEERPQFQAPKHQVANTGNGNNTIASESNHVPSSCPSPKTRSPSPSEEGESRGMSYTGPITVGTPASSQESLRSWHTCQ